MGRRSPGQVPAGRKLGTLARGTRPGDPRGQRLLGQVGVGGGCCRLAQGFNDAEPLLLLALAGGVAEDQIADGIRADAAEREQHVVVVPEGRGVRHRQRAPERACELAA